MAPKKQKEQTLSLDDFAKFAGNDTSTGSWADDEADFSQPTFQTSASQSSSMGFNSGPAAGSGGWISGSATTGSGPGGFSLSSSSRSFGASAPIPDVPPFTARVGNVSYEVTEQALEEFFFKQRGLAIEKIRLPRDTEGRVRGTAYIDFTTRDALVEALKLGGQQILGRTVSVNAAEQRSGGSGFGGDSFDWSRRQGPTGGEGPSFGSGSFGGAQGDAQGDKFDRFRPKQRTEETALNWGSRQGPTDGSGSLGGSGPIGGSGQRRREPEAPKDWSIRSAPPQREPRAPRAEEPSFDWSKRAAVQSQRPRQAAPRHQPRESAPLDWSKRSSGRAPSVPSVSPTPIAPSVPVSQSSVDSTAQSQKPVDSKLKKLQVGFNALRVDDDEVEEATSTISKPVVQPESIGAIQEAQRGTGTEGWKEV